MDHPDLDRFMTSLLEATKTKSNAFTVNYASGADKATIFQLRDAAIRFAEAYTGNTPGDIIQLAKALEGEMMNLMILSIVKQETLDQLLDDLYKLVEKSH